MSVRHFSQALRPVPGRKVKELKCDVDARNGSGNSALHMGAEYDYYLICKMLLESYI